MTEELPPYVRHNPETGQFEIVNCPYEWVPITRGQISPLIYTGNCINTGSVLCLGSCCAIYPCERVRDFMEGRI